MPDLFEKLRGVDSVPSLLAQFQALTVTRNTSAFGARFDETEGDVWTVPEERLKGRDGHVSEFRISLSRQAKAIVDTRREFASGEGTEAWCCRQQYVVLRFKRCISWRWLDQ